MGDPFSAQGPMCYAPGQVPTTNYWADPAGPDADAPFVNPYLEAGRNQNMTPADPALQQVCWSFEGDDSAAVCRAPFEGTTMDVPIDANACAEANLAHPLFIAAYAASGEPKPSPVVLEPGDSGSIAWSSARCKLAINGAEVANEGTLGVDWKGKLLEDAKDQVFEFKAVFEDGKVATHKVVFRINGSELAPSFTFKKAFAIKGPLVEEWIKRVNTGATWYEISKAELAWEIQGVVARVGARSFGAEGEIGKTIIDTVTASLASGKVNLLEDLDLNFGGDAFAQASSLGEANASVDLGVKGGVEVAYSGFHIGEDGPKFPVAGKLEIGVSVLSFSVDQTSAKWKADIATIGAGLSMTGGITIPVEGAEFKGTITFKGSLTLKPNYKVILTDLARRYPWISAITFDVLLLGAVFVGFVALLVCAYQDLKVSYELARLRDVEIPHDSDLLVEGFEDGLYDRRNRNLPAGEADAAVYRSGQDIGDKKRQELLDKAGVADSPSRIDEWLRNNGRAEVQRARVQLPNQLRRDLWAKRAKATKDPEDQYWSWIYICGDCPASRSDPSWLALWKQEHTPDPVHPGRDGGSW